MVPSTSVVEASHKPVERTIRPELNIERWQIFTTSQFAGNSRVLSRGNAKVVVGRIKDNSSDTGYKEVGILRTPELKCYYALIKLWESSGKPLEMNVLFSVREIAEILGMSWGGRSFELIEEWLDRLKKIPIDWVNAFYQKDEDVIESLLHSFNILSDLVIYKRKESGHLAAAFSSFKFHERILRNLISQHMKPLNLDVILGFKKELSVLLYRYLDLVMADKTHYERNTYGLIREELQLEGKRYSFPSRRKQVLEPVLKELEGAKLSTGVLKYARLHKTAGGKEWKAVFKKEPFSQLPPSRAISAEVRVLVEDILAVTQDEHSRPFYIKLAKLAVEQPKLQDLIYRCLSEVKYEAHEGLIRTTKGAVFTDKIKRYCKERGIDLGLRSQAACYISISDDR